MHFTLVKIIPERASSSNCFDDVILPLHYALARLGFAVETRVNALNPHSVNVLFGTCLTPALHDALPANSVIFNLEQVASPSCQWRDTNYLKQMKNYTVWEYSPRNARYLQKSLGFTNVVHVPLGYVPEMTRLRKDFPRDIDVLFYGALNERRQRVLDELKASGIRLGILQNAYGAERDHAIARAKLVLNVHFYTPATLEMPRLGYLWANSRAVASERQPETEMFPGLEQACAYASYEKLVPTVLTLLRDKSLRTLQAETGFALFSRRRQEDLLAEAVGSRTFSVNSARATVPDHLHAGSGKDFRPACLNIDINSAMNPDLALDLSLPLDHAALHRTVRFGDIRLMPGKFSRITAFEMLEHVRDLPQTMRNFLDLLRDGGELELSVPYELSPGAWQDPTHVRAFNEMSWIYYCEWAWYMGWRENRFRRIALHFTLSEYGKKLEAAGASSEELLRMPRAVDGMRVVLKKRTSTVAEKEEYDRMQRAFYEGAVGEWKI